MNLDFEKQGGLIPAIIQDAVTNKVLMLGYMNKESLDKTIETKKASDSDVSIRGIFGVNIVFLSAYLSLPINMTL